MCRSRKLLYTTCWHIKTTPKGWRNCGNLRGIRHLGVKWHQGAFKSLSKLSEVGSVVPGSSRGRVRVVLSRGSLRWSALLADLSAKGMIVEEYLLRQIPANAMKRSDKRLEPCTWYWIRSRTLYNVQSDFHLLRGFGSCSALTRVPKRSTGRIHDSERKKRVPWPNQGEVEH